MKLLLVEDNRELARSLMHLLSQSSYIVEYAKSGEEASLLLSTQSYDLVLLDLNLPGIKGQNLLKRIRTKNADLPVLIISAQSDSKTIVENLDLGADDYLTKPFQIDELEARMRTLIRRVNGKKSPVISCGSLTYDTNSKIFKNRDQVIDLTPKEHAVLEMMILKLGKTISKQEFINSLYSINDFVSPSALEIYTLRIRKKITGSGAQIITLRGLGYMLSFVPDEA